MGHGFGRGDGQVHVRGGGGVCGFQHEPVALIRVHPHDIKCVYLGAVGELERLADGLLPWKQCFSKHVAHNGHRAGFFLVLLREEAPAGQLHAVGGGIFGVHARGVHAGFVRVCAYRIAAKALCQADSVDAAAVKRAVIRQHLIRQQVLRAGSGWAEHARLRTLGVIAVAFLRQADGDVVRAHALHAGGDGVRHAARHRHDSDDRADADDDAQHREQRAHLVGPQAVEGKLDVFKQQHPQRLLPCARP